ncbi:MAG: substrate-binding domain-containing protein, partial [Actinomycetota bacterium]|nr:substrate-binding domain-containing protein [Actinomycetota bacterium]
YIDLEPGLLVADLVRADHHGGALLATQHLQAHGHRDIAFFGDDQTISSARLRLRGYREAMSRYWSDLDEARIVHGHHSSDVWRGIIRQYLTEPAPPTALFTAQNFITVGATQALHDLELHERIALVGFDEIELADVVRPGISVVPQDPLGLGQRAATRLFARIDGLDGPPTRQIIQSSVVARGSGEIPPYRELVGDTP